MSELNHAAAPGSRPQTTAAAALGPAPTAGMAPAAAPAGDTAGARPAVEFRYRTRLDPDALGATTLRARDDLVEFEMLMEFAISRSVRRQAVDLSILDCAEAIERVAALPSFLKALGDLRRFAKAEGWRSFTVRYGEDGSTVVRMAPNGAVRVDNE